MSTEHTCPQCHATLPPDAPAGLCPLCLIRSAAGVAEPTQVDGTALPDIANAEEVARRLPQYEIIELLGKGGMGVVYKARQTALDRFVALKILPPAEAQSPDFVERFRREARALAKLSHPNIVTVHECGESGGLYYFAMEYVDGANLRALLQGGKLTPAEALAIVPRVCDALEYAHAEGVIHRDIKPENLLLDQKGRVKIADFGLAKLLRRESLDVTLTLSGAQLGTIRYMAPEQMDKPETVDHRADIYSLGVVIYEMLTGEVPMGRFALPSEKAQVDVRLDEIVLRSLERDVERRYQHASEVRSDVEHVATHPGPPPLPVSFTAPPVVPERKPFAIFVRTILWFVLLLGTLVFFWPEIWRDTDFMSHTLRTTDFASPTSREAGFVSRTRNVVTLGMGDPWLIWRQAPVSGLPLRIELLSGSALMGLFAFLSAAILWSTRIRRPKGPARRLTPAQWLNVAAIALFVAGASDAIVGAIWFGYAARDFFVSVQFSSHRVWMLIVMLLSLFSISAVYFTIRAAVHLLRRDKERDITFSLAFAAIVPPGCFLALPAAIVALIYLHRPEGKALFPKEHPIQSLIPPT